MKSKILSEKEIEKLSDKELAEYLGLGRPIPKSAWRKEVRDLSAVELIRLHRKELEKRKGDINGITISTTGKIKNLRRGHCLLNENLMSVLIPDSLRLSISS